jgi:hypothetical protein
MTTIGGFVMLHDQDQAPASSARSSVPPRTWFGFAVRVLLLAMLALGAAQSFAAAHPALRNQSDLVADMRSGRVTFVDYRPSDRRVRWLDGWTAWRATTIEAVDTSPAVSGDPVRTWLQEQIETSGHADDIRFGQPPLDIHVGQPYSNRGTLYPLPGVPWSPAFAVAPILTFLVMLSRSRHSFANRWAWFWMFSVSFISPAGWLGLPLYLLLEPWPLWRIRGGVRLSREPQMRGGAGCLGAIALSIVIGALGILVR